MLGCHSIPGGLRTKLVSDPKGPVLRVYFAVHAYVDRGVCLSISSIYPDPKKIPRPQSKAVTHIVGC